MSETAKTVNAANVIESSKSKTGQGEVLPDWKKYANKHSVTKSQAKHDLEAMKITENLLSGKVKIEEHPRANKPAKSNRKGGGTPTDAQTNDMTERFARVLRFLLPGLLVKLSHIEDCRDQRKVRHSLPALMIYGIMVFLSHTVSRRKATGEISKLSLLPLINEFVPGTQDMPHCDTLNRLLCGIDVESIDKCYIEAIAEFINSDKFNEINPGRILVALDGTGKFSRKYLWDDRALSRNLGEPGKERYLVYVLESVLILENDTVLPLLTEFLENSNNHDAQEAENGHTGTTFTKQDCESKACHRMMDELHKLFGSGRLTLVMDGLYANGPIISHCNRYNWEFMINLKRNSLTTVWDDFDGLCKLDDSPSLITKWGNRKQEYHWQNGLDYTYGKNHTPLRLNLVTCKETWVESHSRSGKISEIKATSYAWLSSERITNRNAFNLCTKTARRRWRIENHFLVEKHQGYSYTHTFSYNWDAMKGFHYLMKIGHFLNEFIAMCVSLNSYVRNKGKSGLVSAVWESLKSGKWPLQKEESAVDSSVRGCRKKTDFPELVLAPS
jgi:hypothetical protein